MSSFEGVIEGQVRVSTVSQWADRPDVKVWEIDCHSKYAGSNMAYGDGSGTLMLYKDEHTLRCDDTTALPTKIEFNHPRNETWFYFIDGGRYSFFVIAVRTPEKVNNLWVSPREALGPNQQWGDEIDDIRSP